jgi:hypothetical protein
VRTEAELTAELAALHADYTDRLNLLLDEGREDLAAILADHHLEDAARLLLRSGTADLS